LQAADASGAIFARANLFQATATGLTAPEARFTGADLTYADFSHAILDRADLAGVTFNRTNFHEVSDIDAHIPSRSGALATDPDRTKSETWHQRSLAC
jgi:uncharacterized protein YjbI with pentapeptide repeats